MGPNDEHENVTRQPSETAATRRRRATVYDAVAGCIGRNGFLRTDERQPENVASLKPEQVLLRRLDRPQETFIDHYNADERVAKQGLQLPDSELLKDIHVYVADFFETTTGLEYDFRSLDDTALIAMGILLEEAAKEAIGETGDMVFSEPRSVDRGLTDNKWTRHQIIGKVVPQVVHEYHSASDESESDARGMPGRKRQRRHYRYSDD